MFLVLLTLIKNNNEKIQYLKLKINFIEFLK